LGYVVCIWHRGVKKIEIRKILEYGLVGNGFDRALLKRRHEFEGGGGSIYWDLGGQYSNNIRI